MITYEVVLTKEEADILAKRSDDAGVIDDLEYLETHIREWLNKD